jgi:hypothetical protein
MEALLHEEKHQILERVFPLRVVVESATGQSLDTTVATKELIVHILYFVQ